MNFLGAAVQKDLSEVEIATYWRCLQDLSAYQIEKVFDFLARGARFMPRVGEIRELAFAPDFTVELSAIERLLLAEWDAWQKKAKGK